MNSDLLVKITTLLAGLISTVIVFIQLLRGRPAHLREDYRFAREFLKDLHENANMHSFLREKGFQAIAGNSQMSGAEVEYLLTFHDSVGAIKDFDLGFPYLEYLATANGSKINFKTKYRSAWSRRWRKYWYYFLYLVLFLLAFAPTFFPSVHVARVDLSLGILVATAALFLPPGFLALKAAVRILRAEALIRRQPK